MVALHTIFNNFSVGEEPISSDFISSVVYHDIFDYPLSEEDLLKWATGRKVTGSLDQKEVKKRNGLYFLSGRDGIVLKRIVRGRVSERKMKIAAKAANLLSIIPGIKMIAVTGALAMDNASEESDIDMMIVCKNGSLWTTRLLTLLFLDLFRIKRRRVNDKDQKDKLCLNLWLDETDVVWEKSQRNIYTAHEIGQIKPLVNKDGVYERFIGANVWIKDYWPNAVKLNKRKTTETKLRKQNFIEKTIEKVAFKFQYMHMKKYQTREVVTASRALFHPYDWGGVVLGRFRK